MHRVRYIPERTLKCPIESHLVILSLQLTKLLQTKLSYCFETCLPTHVLQLSQQTLPQVLWQVLLASC
jgi:hypothetical protein